MSNHYYIDNNGLKDGPHDLVSLMRRIRSGKLTANSSIYLGESPEPVVASAVEEIAGFFERTESSGKTGHKRAPSILSLLAKGWHFTMEHNVITVFSGAFLLMSILMIAGFYERWGLGGVILSMGVIMFMHHLFLVFMIRLYRGQTLGPEFFNKHLQPIIFTLLLSAVVLALLMMGGFVLLVVPGIIITILYIFSPFLILDYRFSPIEAMHGSRLLLMKHGWDFLGTTAGLVWLYILSAILILPMLLAMPIFAIALAELYEEVAAA